MTDISRIKEQVEGKNKSGNIITRIFYNYPFASVAGGLLILCLLAWGSSSLVSVLFLDTRQEIPLDAQHGTVPADAAIALPLISEIQVTAVSESAATIGWSTDIPSTGTVKYWTDDPDNALLAMEDTPAVIHNMELAGLQPDTVYRFVIKATGETGLQAADETIHSFTTAPAVIPISPEVGYRAPDFTLLDIDDNIFNFYDLQGKWLMLYFWETDCTACRSSLPHIQQYYGIMPADKINLVSINYRESNKMTLVSLVKNRGVQFPVLLDTDGLVSQSYKITGFPTIFVINPDGIIKKVSTGKMDSSEQIEQLVKSVTGF